MSINIGTMAGKCRELVDTMTRGGSKRWIFSETADNRDFTVCIISCVYRAQLILGQIVYLSYNAPCPIISIHKSEIKVH